MFFCIYSDEEMTKIPETVNAGTDGDPMLRFLALLDFLTLVVLIVIPLVVFYPFSRFFHKIMLSHKHG